ncbi:MAG: hypothetical protein M5U19_21340 [Microthrixaceae bacterium]|nr:hypothetical protein [Microthrixaceae bacterium]
MAFTVLSGDSTAGAAVRLEGVDDVGDDPFTDSVAIGPAVEFPGNVQAVNASVREELAVDTATATRVAEGTAPGLYGGSGDRAVCDPAKLVEFLEDQPAKATAWAAALGVDRSAIRILRGFAHPGGAVLGHAGDQPRVRRRACQRVHCGAAGRHRSARRPRRCAAGEVQLRQPAHGATIGVARLGFHPRR